MNNPEQEIYTSLVKCLFSDLEMDELSNPPTLVHYTSIEAVEKILSSNELWLSNPLFMNDLEELRFGMIQGYQTFIDHEGIRGCFSEENYEKLITEFKHHYNNYANDFAIDTYVFCLSEHDLSKTDGKLSMWRGYGGNGNGVALVLNSELLNEDIEGSPFIMSKVEYASTEKRKEWLNKKFDDYSDQLQKLEIKPENLHLVAYAAFERIKLFALFTKHDGFKEEDEWRIVYLRERDNNNLVKEMFGYTIGKRGIEPKLKFKLQSIKGVTPDNFDMKSLIKQIILGPTISKPITQAAFEKMLKSRNHEYLIEKIKVSSIPLRDDSKISQ